MNNINIKNLFVNSDLNPDQFANEETLNVYNLVESKVFINSLDDDFIINKIKNNEKNEKLRTKDLYETKYRECLNKINDAIDMKLTDVFFTVGDNFFGYKNYNSKKCLEYIQNKLRKKNFDTLITNYKSIFVSWKNIVNSLQ
jgi:hypothetical protein